MNTTAMLSNQSWPDTDWDPKDKPVVLADGKVHAVNDLSTLLEVSAAYVVGLNETAFARLCRFVRTTSLHFYEMGVADLAPLTAVGDLRHLSVRWNTKCADLSVVAQLGSLDEIAGKDVMVVGKRRPFLNSTEDATKLAKYVDRFRALQQSFADG